MVKLTEQEVEVSSAHTMASEIGVFSYNAEPFLRSHLLVSSQPRCRGRYSVHLRMGESGGTMRTASPEPRRCHEAVALS